MNIASLLFIQGYLSTYIIIEQIDKIRVAQRDKILTNTNIKKHFFDKICHNFEVNDLFLYKRFTLVILHFFFFNTMLG